MRPLSEQEAEKGAAWRIENNKIVPLSAATSQYASENAYTLDYVFGSEWSTQAVYERTTEDIIKKVVGGFNGTVFAYGQTSSGKTHTMRGTQQEPGIIPLAVAEIFRQIHSLQDREFLLRVSYMEVIPSTSTSLTPNLSCIRLSSISGPAHPCACGLNLAWALAALQ